MAYDPNINYGKTTATTAPGQGSTTTDGTIPVDTSDPSVVGYTRTQDRYLNTVVPGTYKTTPAPRDPGLAVAGQIDAPTVTAPKTLGQLQSDLYDMAVSDTQGLTALQEQLIQAGLLSPTAKGLGIGTVSPGDPTDKAYTRLLREAVDTGGDYNVILSTLAANPDNKRGQAYWGQYLGQQQAAQRIANGGGTTTSSAYILTDPNAARALVNNSLESHLGRRATSDEQAQFHSLLQNTEMAAPERSTDTYGGSSGGMSPYVPKSRVSISQRPDPSALADAFSRGTQGRADEVGAQNEVDFTNVLARLLGAGH